MKTTIIKSWVLLLLAGMCLTGCEQFLTPENKTTGGQEAEGYFSNDPATLRVYAYSLLKPVVARVDVYEEGVDLYMASNKKSGTQFDQYTITPENADVKSLYADLYACINMANATIQYDNAGKYTAEMVFLRSYCYYILSQQFGGVPYTNSYINDSKREYPRTELKTLYESLISDLTNIVTDASLPETASDGTASRRAAKALLAKVYLAAGWDLNTTLNDAVQGTYTIGDKTYFQEALKWAKEAINNQSLSMPFEDKWSPKNESNEEVLFAVQYDRAGWPGELKTGGHGLQNTFGSYYGDCTSSGEKYVDGLHASNPKSSYLWTAEDERYEGTFMTTMYNCELGGWGTVGYYAYYNADQAALDTMPIHRKFFSGTTPVNTVSAYQTAHAAQLVAGTCANDAMTVLMTYPNVKAGAEEVDYLQFVNTKPGMSAAPVVKKFDDPNSSAIAVNKTNGYRDIVVLHLSDIYLVAAEAALMAGDEGAAETYINAVRARAGVAATTFAAYTSPYASIYGAFTNTPIDLVLDERARELYAEGHRWMDLRRTKQLVRYNNIFNTELAGNAVARMSNAAGDIKWYRPIPQAEINSNNSITEADQNKGY